MEYKLDLLLDRRSVNNRLHLDRILNVFRAFRVGDEMASNGFN
jgi:hypothetical protein